MADAYLPRVERAFRQMQKPHYQACDRAAVALMAVVTMSFVMYAAGSVVLSIPVLAFNASADVNVATLPVPNASRAHRRLLHRVEGAMQAACTSDNDVVFGAQILVSGKAFAHSIARICSNRTTLVNPAIVEYGESTANCVDEHQALKKIKARPYPLTVQVKETTHTYTNVQDACIIWTIMEMLNGTW